MMQRQSNLPEKLWARLKSDEQTPLTHIDELKGLAADEAVRLLHQAVAPRASQLQPPTNWLISWGIVTGLINLARFGPDALFAILVGFLFIALLVVLVAFLPESHKRRERSERLLSALSELAVECRSAQILPELLDFLHWLSHTLSSPNRRALEIAVARLLARASENELPQLLTPTRRALLRRLCTFPTTAPALVRAALLVLGSVQDQETLPIARKLSRQPEFRDAAEAFLDVVSRN